MKKHFIWLSSIFLCLCLLFSLAGCGGEEAVQDDDSALGHQQLPTIVSGNSDQFFYTNDVLDMMGGQVVHTDGYTYFIERGLNNDGSITGLPYSTDIYRVGDEPGAVAELFYTAPALQKNHYSSDYSLSYLMAYGDSLYFIQRKQTGELELHKEFQDERYSVSQDLSSYGSLQKADVSGNKLYLFFDGIIILYDLETGKFNNSISDFDWSRYDPVTVYDGHLYLVERDANNYLTGIFRQSLKKGTLEDFYKPTDTERELLSDLWFDAAGGYLFYLDYSDRLYSVCIETRSKITLAERTCREYITGNGRFVYFYDYRDGSINKCSPDGSNRQVIATANEQLDGASPFCLYVAGDWLMYRGTAQFDRGSRVPTDELFARSHGAEGISQKSIIDIPQEFSLTEGDWIVSGLPNYAYISSYDGKDAILNMPSSICGINVNILYRFGYTHGAVGNNNPNYSFTEDDPYWAEELYLPNTIKTVDLSNVRAKSLYLPTSIEIIIYTSDYKNDDLTDVYFQGSIEQWKQLTAYSNALNYGLPIENEMFTVHCSNGDC